MKLFHVTMQRLLYARQSGFSLIELSIFITVAAISITAFIAAVAPSGEEEANKIAITKARLEEVNKAIIAFRVLQGRLPCPARRTLEETDTDYGLEDCAGVTAAGAVANDASVGTIYNLGVVPVRTLGLSRDYWLDGWGRRFTYEVAKELCNVQPPPLATPGDRGLTTECDQDRYNDNDSSDFLIIHTTDVTAASGLTNTQRQDPANGAEITPEAAYVVLSHGTNGDGAWTPGGAQRLIGGASGATRKQLENFDKPDTTALALTVPSDTPTYNAPKLVDSVYWVDKYTAEYDDLIVYGTKRQLDLASRTLDRPVMSKEECMGLSKAITNYEISNLPLPNASDTDEDANLHMFESLWLMQEICAIYYPFVYDVHDTEERDGGSSCDPLDADPDNWCVLGGSRGYGCPGGSGAKGPDNLGGAYAYAKGFAFGDDIADLVINVTEPDPENLVGNNAAACRCTSDEEHSWNGGGCG